MPFIELNLVPPQEFSELTLKRDPFDDAALALQCNSALVRRVTDSRKMRHSRFANETF